MRERENEDKLNKLKAKVGKRNCATTVTPLTVAKMR